VPESEQIEAFIKRLHDHGGARWELSARVVPVPDGEKMADFVATDMVYCNGA